MRYLLALLMTLLLCVACSGPTPEELASLAAKSYYDHLIHEEYELFLEGKHSEDSLPADYRQQLLDNYRQFMAHQKVAHHGIREVRVVNAKADTLLKNTHVFLVLCFGDSTNEEIVVPMVEHRGKWMMK